jgi:hypothetical protein
MPLMMKKFFYLCLLCSNFIFIQKIYAGNTLSSSIIVRDINGKTISSTIPKDLYDYTQNTSNSYVGSFDVTLSGQMSSYTFTDLNYTKSNWGIVFVPSSGNSISCTILNPSAACQNTKIDVQAWPTETTPTSGTYSFSNITFTLHVIVTFNNPTTILPQEFINLLNSGSVRITYAYSPSGSTTTATQGDDFATWQPDQGTFINGPVLAEGFQSVVAKSNGFEVTNINPPSDTSAACPVNATAPTTCLNDGSGATSLTKTTLNNTVSGYIIGFWNNATCSIGIGGYNFAPNWMAYNYSTPIASYPTQCDFTSVLYKQSYGVGGISNNLGCTSAIPSFLTSGAGITTPNAETAAIPYIGIETDAKADLKKMIESPNTVFNGPNSCINYVYIKSTQTYTNSDINKGDTYGIVVWALNSASDTVYKTPNYSLNHSNIFYTTTSNFVLASTEKDSTTNLTTDCFVVTAASGDINSPSVFYWRLLRDSYLTQLGISKIYYQHAHAWAKWLNNHPSLKPPLNFIFEKSGSILYHTSVFAKKTNAKAKIQFHKLINFISSAFENQASAQELAYEEIPDSNNKMHFGFDNHHQQNIDVSMDDMNNSSFFNTKGRNTIPNYDFSITGGSIFPTTDKSFYNKYYSSQPSLYGSIGTSRLFWFNKVGLSLGLMGRYLTNKQKDDTTTLNTPQSYERSFYDISAEVTFRIHYRNPNWTYLQPSVYGAIGANRFRETASSSQNSSSSSELGATVYSPIYEGGITLDTSLTAISGQTSLDTGDLLNEVLFRLSGGYIENPTKKGLSLSGYNAQAGFVFLLN